MAVSQRYKPLKTMIVELYCRHFEIYQGLVHRRAQELPISVALQCLGSAFKISPRSCINSTNLRKYFRQHTLALGSGRSDADISPLSRPPYLTIDKIPLLLPMKQKKDISSIQRCFINSHLSCLQTCLQLSDFDFACILKTNLIFKTWISSAILDEPDETYIVVQSRISKYLRAYIIHEPRKQSPNS